MMNTPCDPPLTSHVKELADHLRLSPSSLPSVFITRSAADVEAETIVKEIPKIDFSLLCSGKPEDRFMIVRDIERACKEWGCFALVNHGISESLQLSVLEAFKEFFDLSIEEKELYSINQLLDSVNYGSGYSLTAREGRYWREFLRIIGKPEFNFPTKPAGFRAVSEEYTRQTREIFNELLRAIWESLELEEGFMEDYLQLKLCCETFVGNLYPPCPQPKLVLGMPPHTDPCLLSVIIQNKSFNSLEVMHDGKWVGIDIAPQSLVIFIGDLMEIVTNGRYKGILHRVLVSNESTRISVGSSIGPAIESVIAPVPKLLERSNSPAIFRGITFKEFTELRMNNKSMTYALDLIRV